MRALITLTAVVPAALLLAGCEYSTEPPASPPPAVRVTVAPSLATIDGGSALRLIATIREADGTTTRLATAAWSSSNQAIARVNGSGLVQGGAAGEARVFATWRGIRGSALVKVRPVTVKPTPEQGCPTLVGADGSTRIPRRDDCRI